jgi:hypothetical protein
LHSDKRLNIRQISIDLAAFLSRTTLPRLHDEKFPLEVNHTDMSSPGKKERRIPFDFVLEQLEPLNPMVRPMFGCEAVYVGEKIMLVLRLKEGSTSDNGIWLATTTEHHESLRRVFPSLKSIEVLGQGVTGWQVLPSSTPDFEQSAMRVCQLIISGDERIGKVPKQKAVRPTARRNGRSRKG